MPTTPDGVLEIARAELAAKVRENPAGSNCVKYNQWYYGRDAREPWCAAFVSWCFYQAGLPLPASTSKGFVYTPSGAAWFQKQSRWVPFGQRRPEPGWVAFFDFPGDNVNRISHVGIVEALTEDGFLCIEGNSDERGGRTGGKVVRHHRRTGVKGYGIPNFDVGHPAGLRAVSIPAWIYKEEDVQTKWVEIPLDANGNGWTWVEPNLGREPIPVAVVPHGPFPQVDGYWDDADEDITFRVQVREAKLVVSAVNGPPGGKANAWVSYA